MKRQNEVHGEHYCTDYSGEGEFEKISSEQKLFINGAGNTVISFEKHEVAPGAAGNPELEIPDGILRDIRKQ